MHPFFQRTDRSLLYGALCFACGAVGAIAGLVYGWAHVFDRVWFYVWLAAALYFLGRRLWGWWITQVRLAHEEPRSTLEQVEVTADREEASIEAKE